MKGKSMTPDQALDAICGDGSAAKLRKIAAEIAAATQHEPPDPRDPRPDHEMAGRHPIFRDHNCARCDSGRRPCVKGDPGNCGNPHARND